MKLNLKGPRHDLSSKFSKFVFLSFLISRKVKKNCFMPYQILKVNYRVTSKIQSKKFFVFLKLLNNARVLLMFTCVLNW